MYNLNSIDLTENRRIERAANNYESNISIINADRNSIYRRLKHGEIPHNSIETRYYSTDLTDITFTNDINDWVVTTTNIDTTGLTWLNADDLDGRVLQSTSTNTVTDFNIWYSPNSHVEGINITIDNTRYAVYTSNNAFINHSLDGSKSNNIMTRLKYDPFDTEFSYSDAYERLKDYQYTDQNDIDLFDRLHDKRNIFQSYDERSTILERLMDENNDNEDSKELFSFFRNDSTADNLKSKAPFIKRVYVTNNGRSFDTTELNFDLILAQEHFDECVKIINTQSEV